MRQKCGVDLDVQLIPGGGGVFEVCADNNIIFSKKQSGRFPGDGEVISLLKSDN